MNDLSTIDHLIEFGMGTALASQMIKTMNQSIGSMTTPGVCNAAPSFNTPYNAASVPPALMFYAAIDGRQAGPLNENELKALISKGLVDSNTLIWRPGMQGWRIASDIPEVNKLLLLYF